MKRVTRVVLGSLIGWSLPVCAAPDYGIAKGNEELLIQGLESLASRQFDTALTQFKELTRQRPDFRLAQLVYADLLAAQVNPLGQVGSAQQQRRKEIQGLIEEAKARLNITKNKPGPDLIPESLIQLSPDQKHIIIVDTSYSRLFLMENRNGQPYLVQDYYASYGRGGTEKQKRGDLKTPLGVYFVTARIKDDALPERYGSGALPINYPNAWDVRHGRTGSGIWLHGSPVDTYSRPPKASEGCVSLTNPDFIDLDKRIDINNTPVLIGHDIKWIGRQAWLQRQNELSRTVENWRNDWESKNHQRYISHYSSQFKDGEQDLAHFSAYKQQVNESKNYIKVSLSDLSLFTYPNNPDLMVATFKQHYQSDNYQSESRKRQYWLREQGKWRIAYEGEPLKGIP